MKLFITSILLALNLSFIITSLSAKNNSQKKLIDRFHQLPCFAVSEDNGSPNILFEYSPATNSWQEIGVTGSSFVEAMAIDPITETIFATDGGTFGAIDENTGIFTTIGEVGTGNGEFGVINLDDVDGLTYNPTDFVIYATHRISGAGPGTNDLLFQIDPATGKVIPNAMVDANGNPADYAVIQEVLELTIGTDVYDVQDIAWNPYTGQLFALHSQNSSGVITILDPYTGKIELVLRDLGGGETMGAMTMTSFGKLLLTTQSNTGEFCIFDALENIFTPVDLPLKNYCYGEINNLKIEALDCLSALNNLALSMQLDPNTQEPVSVGSEITFWITVYNQGDLENIDITLVNYIPDGLTLSDPNWTDVGNGKAYATISSQPKG